MSAKPPRSIRPGAVLAVGLSILTGSCLEPPVAERIEIRFLPDGAATVAVDVRLKPADKYADHPRVAERIAETERGLVEERDAWSRRFAGLEAQRQRTRTDRVKGRVERSVRTARLDDPRRIEAFFADTNVHADFAVGRDWAEFSLLPAGDGPASRDQRKRVAQRMETWTVSAAEYLAAVVDLWEYLDAHPERAKPCLGQLFEDDIAADVRGSLPELEEDEDQRVDRLSDAMTGVASLFEIQADDAWTFDELSRLVYDPFPAPLRVVVPGRIIELEGFSATPSDALEIPGLSLWNAFAALEGRWVAPDPLVAYYVYDQAAQGRPFDLDAFVSKARTAHPAPRAADLRAALEQLLHPAALYRVRWSTAEAADRAVEDPLGGD